MNPTSPLEQLKDIRLPADVSIWPLAWPWWALIFLIITGIGLSIYLRKKNQWRRQALMQLQQIQTEDALLCIQQCNRLLKQVALYRFGKECAPLSGEKWLGFLDDKVKNAIFTEHLSAFANAPDQTARINQESSIDLSALKKAVASWIRNHTC